MSEQQEPIAMLGGIIATLIEQGKAPKSCPHCIDETDCASVDICNAVAGMCFTRPVAQGQPVMDKLVQCSKCQWWSNDPQHDLSCQFRGVAQGVQVPDGFAILPIEPTSMMALRGYQARNVFDENDGFFDYIDASEFPEALAPQHKFDDDERGWMLAAAAYRGCVAGYLETLQRLAKDPKDVVAFGWNTPIRKSSPVSSTHSNTVADSSGSNPGAIGASKEAGGIAGFATVAPASNPSSTNCKCPTPDFCRKQGACEAEECLAPVVTSTNHGGGK